jgi:peptidoglycan lytic transglycosylase D
MTKAGARALLVVMMQSAAVAACARPAAPPATAPVPAAAPTASTSARADSTALLARAANDSAWRATNRTPGDSVAVSASEIERRAQEVFGDSGTTIPLPRDSAMADAEPSWDIDVHSYETHKRVEHFVAAYTGYARERFIAQLARGSRYEPFIRGKLRAAGIPEDMFYLALVESGFDPDAYSRAAAVGMWQFMSSTARGAGLRVDWWVDERRDPIKSTDAAIKFLSWLRDEFGSLYLAAAAYNGGPGRVARGLTRFAEDLEGAEGDDRFFALAEKKYLPQDTKDYVPQIIAAALVAKDPDRYGLTLRALPPYEYDSVTAPAATPLAAVAKATGSTVAEIIELNPHVLRGMTPPDARWRVRVPPGRAAGFDSALAALAPEDRVATRRVQAKKGQTLTSIAAAAGLSARQVRWYNPRLEVPKSGRLKTGQTVVVPAIAVVSAARDVPDPAVEIYGRRASGGRTHVVKKGETLSGIAKRYGTSVSTLMRLNGMRKGLIHPGQRIVVSGSPARARSTSARRTPTRSASTTAKKPPTKATASAPRSSSKATASKSTRSKAGSPKATASRSSAKPGAKKPVSSKATTSKARPKGKKPAAKSASARTS